MHPLFVSLIMSYLYTASYKDTHLFRSQKYLFKDVIEKQMFCIFIMYSILVYCFIKEELYYVSIYQFLGSHQNSLYFRNELY